MAVSDELTRIIDARDTIKTKLVNLGIAIATDKIDLLATKLNGIANNGAVNETVLNGSSYTIPAGYHNGSGKVTGTVDMSQFALQSKYATPQATSFDVTPDTGNYGLSKVTVNAIPNRYGDASSCSIVDPYQVLMGVTVIGKTSSGSAEVVLGLMKDNGAVSKTLQAGESFTIPSGYHNGEGVVSAANIPSGMHDVSDTTATAAQVLEGYYFYDASGNKTEGDITNNGSATKTFNPLTQSSVSYSTGYYTAGSVTLTGDLLTALEAI